MSTKFAPATDMEREIDTSRLDRRAYLLAVIGIVVLSVFAFLTG